MPNVISFRPLERSDFPLLERWLSEPHVDAWWHEPLDLAGLEHKYGPRIDGIEPTHVFIIEHERQPIGWVQWYRWSDYPKHAAQFGAEPNAAGIDLAIGKVSALGQLPAPAAIARSIFACVDRACDSIYCVPEPRVRQRPQRSGRYMAIHQVC